MISGGDLSRRFRGMGIPARRLFATLCVISAIGVSCVQVLAQNISADQLQQLQQMQNRGAGTGTALQPSVATTQTILEPTGVPAALPVSRLEQILSQRAGVRLQQFGYDQLGNGRAVSLPQVGAVQDNYVLGPGDEIVVSLRGQENSEYRVSVDRDGRVVIPRLSPVPAGGRTFGQFREDFQSAIRRAYVSTEAFVSVGRLRQISVLVSGEVGSPGVRTLTGLSTPVDAVLVSGGIKKSGSLRNVQIVRGGRIITVDLYSVLSGQVRANTVALADGDRLIVPPLGRTVAIVGWVRRQGIYELAAGRLAIGTREFINLAGGTEVRGKYRLSLLHIGADGRGQMASPDEVRGVVSDGDILFVQPAASESNSMATLSGGTELAGRYVANGGKLSQLLKSPGALGEDPYTLFGIISRRDPVTKFRYLIPFTPVAVLKGTEDMAIQSDDIVRIITAREARVLFFSVQQYRLHRAADVEAAINPLSAANTPNSNTTSSAGSVGDLANGQGSQAGAAGLAQRQALAAATASTDMTNQGNAQNFGDQSFDQNQQSAVGTQPQVAQPNVSSAMNSQGLGSTSSQFGSMGQFGQGQNLGQGGSSPGVQPRSDDQINPVSTYSGEARRLSDLATRLRVDPLVLSNFLDDHAIDVGGAVQGPGLYLVGPDADVGSVVAAAGGFVRWADRGNVEIISTEVDPNSGQSRTERRTLSLAKADATSYIVAPRDEVRVNEIYTAAGIGSATVQGQVRHTGTYQIVRGEHLSDLLARAGGLTDIAYPYGTVFLRRSAALKEQDAFRRQAQEVENQLLSAMSRRDPNAKMAPDSFVALQNYVKEVRNQKALGRVTVIADPAVLAANPAADPVLEPNDVIFIPPRPYSVAVLGEVLQPSNIPFRSDMSASDYIDTAGGYSQFADTSSTVLVLPDGTARRIEKSWFRFSDDVVPPGSTIFVARDLSGLDMHQILVDFTSIASQLAVSAASLAVLSKQ